MINPETNENLPLLTILVGIQGSGKSTWAGNQDNFEGLLLSSDTLRSEYPNWSNDEIFKEIYKRANESLLKGIDVIIDSTAITIKTRRKMLDAIKVPCIKKALVFNTPYEECKRRLIQRNVINCKTGSHYVPLEVQRQYLESFEIPFVEEGFNYIDVYNKPSLIESTVNLDYIMQKAHKFNQNNKYHTQTLDKHMSATYNYLKQLDAQNKDISALVASSYHDIGKIFTQTYKEGDPNAHYYNHANVGAYWFLSNIGIYEEPNAGEYEEEDMYSTQKVLDTVFYINYHMKMYDLKTEKSINKWKGMFGDVKFRNLELLHEADMNSHKI